MSVIDYPIGAPFHYELEMKTGGVLDDIVRMVNNGKLDIISMDGKVFYNDGTLAIIIIDSRFMEFEGWMLDFDQVCELSPKFRDFFGSFPGLKKNEYVCIDVETGEFVSEP